MNDENTTTLEQLYADNSKLIESIKQNIRKLDELQQLSTGLHRAVFGRIQSGFRNILTESEQDQEKIIDKLPLNLP